MNLNSLTDFGKTGINMLIISKTYPIIKKNLYNLRAH